MAQIWRLSLLNLNQAVLSVEVESLIASVEPEPIETVPGALVRLVEHDLAIDVLLHRRLAVLLVPVDHVAPQLSVCLHPLSHERNARGDLNDPVSDDLHPLEVTLIVTDHTCEEVLEVWTNGLRVEWRARLGSLEHVLKQDEERLDLVVVVLLQASLHNFVEFLSASSIVVVEVHVCF